MKKSDLYEISIKILGIYLFFTSISFLREIVMVFSWILSQEYSEADNAFYTELLVFSLADFVLVILFASLLTFKTKAIVKFVCKQSDYEETSTLFADRKVIYEMALVIMGLILIAWTIPDFVFRLKNYLQADTSMMPNKPNENSFIIIAVIKVVVGILSIVYAKSIATTLVQENKTKQPE